MPVQVERGTTSRTGRLEYTYAHFLAGGCGNGAKEWSLEPLRSVKGFKTPECAEVNPIDGTVYVSNLFAVTRDAVGALDANGFISTLEPGGKVREYKSIQGTPGLPIHGAAGMCFFKGYLYFNDRNGLKRRRLDPNRVPGLLGRWSAIRNGSRRGSTGDMSGQALLAIQCEALLRRYVKAWKRAGPLLERQREEDVKASGTDTIGAFRFFAGLVIPTVQSSPPAPNSGLVEQQKWFRKIAQR